MTDNLEKFQHLKQTPLLQEHLNLGARVVDFGGWALPVNYGSQVDEHHAVRNEVGMFDVSHMTVSEVTGIDTLPFLRKLLANNIDKAAHKNGKALYSCMLNESGGIIDDLIVYYLNDQHCRLVTNAGTNEKDMAWIKKQAAAFSVHFEEFPELALIAVQGPKALETIKSTFPDFTSTIDSLSRFQGDFTKEQFGEYRIFIGRTGYTGEDGVELILNKKIAIDIWKNLIQAGVQPCGLGARDTLRLEAGMALYGNDLDENHNPLESGLKWTVSLEGDREFIGKSALMKPTKYKTIGLLLEDRGVLRGHQTVIIDGKNVGEITSGTFSPSLEKSIAIARINADAIANIDDTVAVDVRNKQLRCRVVKYPFFNNGKASFS